MPKYNQITLIKSTDNTALIHAVLKQANRNNKITIFANKKSDFLKDSLEKLRENLVEFNTLYTHVKLLFLKDSWDRLNREYGEPIFIQELETICIDENINTLCFHRVDTLFECVSKLECELIIADIIKTAHHYDKKIIFTINNKTELGKLLESILTDIVDTKYEIDSNNNYEQQLILINSKNSTKLIKSALTLHKKEKQILLLTEGKSIFLRESFKKVKKELTDFDKIYSGLKCMFLKDDWLTLDKKYGKPFFMYEIQNLIKDDNFSTIYFHRVDNIFFGATKAECKQLIEDIRDFARYYHKKVIFSIDENSKLGKILLPILKDEVDYEYAIEESCDSSVKKALEKPIEFYFETPSKANDKRFSL